MTGARAGAVIAGAGLALAACAPLPQAPPDLPSTFIPDVSAPTAEPEVPVGPDGFSIVERVAMRVSVETCDEYRNGSAWVLDEDTVVTNRHVVEGAIEIELISYDGQHYRGTTAELDPTADLAVVHIDGVFPESATIAEDPSELYERLYVVGYPEGGILTTSLARNRGVAPETLEQGKDDIVVLEATVKPGSSGSPLTDVDGSVVGVIYAGAGNSGAWAVSLESLEDFLDEGSSRMANEALCEA